MDFWGRIRSKLCVYLWPSELHIMSTQLRILPQEATSRSYIRRLVHSQLDVNNAVFCQDLLFCIILSACALQACLCVYMNVSEQRRVAACLSSQIQSIARPLLQNVVVVSSNNDGHLLPNK